MQADARATPASKSEALFARAKASLVGGVSSPVRAFAAVGGAPRFIERAQGPFLFDADGARLLDFVLSWGAVLLGHAQPRVVEAVAKAASRGTTFGAATQAEVALAEALRKDFPSMQRLRFVNSGTEATMSALRAARGFTGRDLAVMFEGCYHGHADPFLARAGSGVAAASSPGSAGVPAAVTRDTVVLPYNDAGALERLLEAEGPRVAAVILEPIAANMGVVLPERDFLRRLRKATQACGSLLIFDEVVTGYRVGRRGAQGAFGVTPDLTCLGKVVGGGLPAAAFGGRAEVMERIAPLGPVYQAGTLSGNPLAMAAGLATLEGLTPQAYGRIDAAAQRLERCIEDAARDAGVPCATARAGGLVGFHLTKGPVRNLADAKGAALARYPALFHALLGRGVYIAPSPLEGLFVSADHDEAAMALAQGSFRDAFAAAFPPASAAAAASVAASAAASAVPSSAPGGKAV